MVDLTIKDAGATGGGCGCGGCGCGGQDAATEQASTQTTPTQQPQAQADGTVAEYTVTGMTCGHCVAAVTEEVSAIPGVTDVAVDLDSGSLKVTSDAPVDLDRIVEAVAEAGDYTVA